MQIVNWSHAVPGVHTTLETAKGESSPVRRWVPWAFLAAVATAIALLGTAVRSADEIDWLTQLAESGNAGAQLQLGLAYLDGRYGVAPSPSKALHWLSISAKSGNAYAEDALGNLYARGVGTEKDMPTAMSWWKRAIADGNPQARLHLGEALINEGQTKKAEELLQR